MARHYKIAVAAAVIALLLIAIWLTFRRGATPPVLTVAFTTVHTHFPEPALVVGDQIIVAWVTNTTRLAITLDMPYAQFETADGRLVLDQGSSWNQQGYSASLAPGSASCLAYGFDPDRQRLKLAFDYHRNGGPLGRTISKVAGILPLKRLPVRIYDWLRRNGMVDGALHGHYEGPWIANPQSGVKGGQTLSSGTNPTAAAAPSPRPP